VQAVKNTIICL